MTKGKPLLVALLIATATACRGSSSSSSPAAKPSSGADLGTTADAAKRPSEASAHLPLVLIGDVKLPGRAVRFDYQDFDAAQGHLIIAHMNDDAVVVVNSSDGSLVKVLPNIPTPRGVVVAGDVGRIFVTSMPNQLVIVDSRSLAELARVKTGRGPDGVGWDQADHVVGVSDQGDGAISLLAESGRGARKQVALGSETGNVVFDAARRLFWITVVAASPPDRLMAVDPLAATVKATIPLPGCGGAHGLRLHPDGKSALIACEDDSKVARVKLEGSHAIEIAPSGAGPDVLSIDPGLGWLYVAAESGELKVFDLDQAGLTLIDRENTGKASHSVAVDPTTHHVFFPLLAGASGTPVLRIMRPAGT